MGTALIIQREIIRQQADEVILKEPGDAIPVDMTYENNHTGIMAMKQIEPIFGTGRIDIKVEQGYEIKRPSLLYLKADEKDGSIDIRVGGRASVTARGTLV